MVVRKCILANGRTLVLADLNPQVERFCAALESTIMISRIASCLAVFFGILLAFVFALSATAKFDDPTDAIMFGVKGLGLSSHGAQRLVMATATAEAILAAWLAFDFGRTLKPGVAGLLLVGYFSGLLLAVAQMHPRSTWSCGCFGALQAPWGGGSLKSHFRFDLFLSAVFFLQVTSVYAAQRRAAIGSRHGASFVTESLVPVTEGM